MTETVLLIALVVVAVTLVGLILIQQGKGADAGASFGSGASQTFFGSEGSGNFLTHSTAVLATVFFVLCLGLAYLSRSNAEAAGVLDFSGEQEVAVPVENEFPVVDVPVSDIPEAEVAVDESLSDAPASSDAPVSGDVPAIEGQPAPGAGSTAEAVESPEASVELIEKE